MTIKKLLGLDASELEAMSDEQLRQTLAVYILPVQQVKASKAQSLIHEPGTEERKEKKKESISGFIERMTKMHQARMAEMGAGSIVE